MRTTSAGPAATTGAATRPLRSYGLGDEKYLWLLVASEVAALFLLRAAFKRHHGG